MSQTTFPADQHERIAEYVADAHRHGEYAAGLAEQSLEIDSATLEEISVRSSWWKSTCVAFDAWGTEDEVRFTNLRAAVQARHTALMEQKYGTDALPEAQRVLIYKRAFFAQLVIINADKNEAEYARLAEFALALAAAR